MDDLISRQAVVDSVNKALSDYTGASLITYASLILDYIKVLPSVQPQKVGKWRHYECYLTCSECEDEFYDDIMEYCGDDVPKYCPNCGAKMEEGE